MDERRGGSERERIWTSALCVYVYTGAIVHAVVRVCAGKHTATDTY